MRFFGCLFLASLVRVAFAASAAEWRSRSIYQCVVEYNFFCGRPDAPRRVIVDRYALPAGADTTSCYSGDRTWCGGTWKTIEDNLDYIQNAGFTASAHCIMVCDS